MNKIDYEARDKFKEEHASCESDFKIVVKSVLGAYVYTVVCNECEKEKDITDYEDC